MDQELKNRLDAVERKIDAVYVSAEKTRKYFLAVLIVSAIAFILPLVGLVFAIPSFMSGYDEVSQMYGL